MAYESLKLASGESKRLAAFRANEDKPGTFAANLAEAEKLAGYLGEHPPVGMIGSVQLRDLRIRAGVMARGQGTNLDSVLAGNSPTGASAGKAAKSFTQADMDKAVAQAVAGERARIANVFASEPSRGRERVCAKLLAHAAGWSSKSIIAELPSLPNDSAVAARPGRTRKVTTIKKAASSPGAAADSWDKAFAKLGWTSGSANSAGHGPNAAHA